MSIVLTILLWTVLGVLGVIVLVGLLPLRIELALRKRDTWRYSAALRPFAGHGPRLLLTGEKSRPDPEARKPTKKHRKPGRKWKGEPMRILHAGRRLLNTILRRVRIEKADIDFKFGLCDPADTGQAFGLLAPMIYGSCSLPRMRVQVEPVFGENMLRGRADLHLSFIPLLLLVPLVRFGWSIFGAKA